MSVPTYQLYLHTMIECDAGLFYSFGTVGGVSVRAPMYGDHVEFGGIDHRSQWTFCRRMTDYFDGFFWWLEKQEEITQ